MSPVDLIMCTLGLWGLCGTVTPLGSLECSFFFLNQLEQSTKYTLKLFPGPSKGYFSHILDLVFKLRLCHKRHTLDLLRNGVIYNTASSELFVFPLNSA